MRNVQQLSPAFRRFSTPSLHSTSRGLYYRAIREPLSYAYEGERLSAKYEEIEDHNTLISISSSHTTTTNFIDFITQQPETLPVVRNKIQFSDRLGTYASHAGRTGGLLLLCGVCATGGHYIGRIAHSTLMGSMMGYSTSSTPLSSKPGIIKSTHLNFPTLLAKRNYSTDLRTVRITALSEVVKPERELDLKRIMEDLRDLELLDSWREIKPRSANSYKDAARCLYPLWHTVDESSIKITFEQLRSTLPAVYTQAWTIITERLTTGRVAKLDELDNEDKAAVMFMQVHGIGRKYAERFIAEGATTFANLPKKCSLTKAQKIGLRHREDVNRLIPRVEMDKLKEALTQAVTSSDKRFECEILGSYRRGVAFSADIDLVIRHASFTDSDDKTTAEPLMTQIIQSLLDANLIQPEDKLSFGAKKYAGLIKLPDHKHFRRIDIRLAPYDSYPYMMLSSSGDALLMKYLRHTAKSKGYCLNEYGMGDKYSAEDQNPNGFKPNTLKVVKNEREIFDLLGCPYLEPKDREYATWAPIYRKAGIDFQAAEQA